MKATIDKAGRLVIPAAVRDRAGLRPGTEVEVFVDDIAIHLVRTGPEPTLVHRGRRIIAQPTAKREDLPEVDLASMIEEERNRWPW